MNPLLFEKDATNFATRGLYSLPDAISCVVTEERNGEYELEMEYPIDGAYFDEILEDRIIVAAPHQNGTKQAFRIYRREVDLEGVTTFFARHISYQLNFIPVDLVSGQTDSAQTMMEDIAGAAEGTQPFSFWSDITTLTPIDWAVTVPSGLRAALGGQEGSVLDRFGGEFEWDNWTVKLHEHRGADNGVKISYGKNLTELSDALDIGDTITGVMAYYQYDDEGTIRTIYTSPKVISVAVNPYAHARVVPLDCSDQFDEPPTQADLTTYADAWLRRTANADPVNEVTISFVPLGQTTEYSYDEDLDSVHLCDTVHIRYPAIGLTASKQVTRTEWDVLAERYNEITLGEETSLADTIVDLQNGGSSGGGSSGGSIDLLSVYPIGAIYMSVSSVSPEVLFGGQWARITGAFLLAGTDGGAQGGNSDAEIAPGYSGGEAFHKLTEGELPSVTGYFDIVKGGSSGTSNFVRAQSGKFTSGTGGTSANAGDFHTASHSMQRITYSFGQGLNHNNMPPYISVYVWQRLA